MDPNFKTDSKQTSPKKGKGAKKRTSPEPKSNEALLKKQITDLTEALQRERADADNVRRRAEEDRLKWANYYKSSAVKELIPVLDAAASALDAASKSKLTKEGEGMVAVLNKFSKTLFDLGLQKIEALDQPFDENLHEAVTTDSSEGESGIVTQELQSGYKLGDEVLRHSMVAVRQ